MKKSFLKKSVSILLIFIFSFFAFSCEKNRKSNYYDKNRRLEILDAQAQYSEEYIQNANHRFTKIAKSLILSYTSFSYNESELSNLFNETLIPILYKVNIYEEELDEVLSLLEGYLDENDGTISKKPLFLSIYDTCLYVLGEERSARLIYEVLVVKLTNDVKNYNEKYDKLGYSFYKTDANRCSALREDLLALGEEKFRDALTIATTVLSSFSSLSAEVNENAFLLTDEELLFILERHGKNLTERSLSEEEWQTLGGIFSEYASARPKTLNSAVVYALKSYTHSDVYDESNPKTLYQSKYFATLMKAMPKMVSLYTELSKKLSENGDFSLSSTAEEKRFAIISALAECDGEIRALDLALRSYGTTESEYLKDNVSKNADAEALEAFLNGNTPITCEELISALSDMKESGVAEDDALLDLLTSYVFSYSPYLAFTISLNY